jgi:small subunit ribosomal protein S21
MSKYWNRNSAVTVSGLKVEVRDGNVERAIKTLNKKLQESGKLKALKEREYFVKPSVKKRMARKAAVKRYQKDMADARKRNMEF